MCSPRLLVGLSPCSCSTISSTPYPGISTSEAIFVPAIGSEHGFIGSRSGGLSRRDSGFGRRGVAGCGASAGCSASGAPMTRSCVGRTDLITTKSTAAIALLRRSSGPTTKRCCTDHSCVSCCVCRRQSQLRFCGGYGGRCCCDLTFGLVGWRDDDKSVSMYVFFCRRRASN
eukprot:869968-Rhodomonas_salina.2